MSRLVLFLLLVLALPAGLYWAGHRFESPDRSVNRFLGEVREIFWGTRPETGEDLDARANRLLEEQRRRIEREAAEREKAQEAAREEAEREAALEPALPDRPEPEGKPTSPGQVAGDPLAAARRHFDAGRFAAAAAAYADRDEAMRGVAELGVAFVKAVPEATPRGVYAVVVTRTGDEYEGYLRESGGLVTLTSPTGKSLSFPAQALKSRVTLTREQAVDRIAARITAEGVRPGLTGARLFALLEESLAVGRPDVAAPLIERALEMDEKDPFILSSVRNRIDLEHQADLYRSFASCQVAQVAAHTARVETLHAPRGLNGSSKKRFDGAPRRPGRNPIRSKEARALMRKATPLRKEGQHLYRKLYATPIATIDVAEIDRAVNLLEEAASLYEKAILIEDADEIDALLRYCSKLAFQLRVRKQWAEGR